MFIESAEKLKADAGLAVTAQPIKRWGADIPLYSQEYVSALLAELEAKDKRIAELSVGKVGNALLERENHHVEVVDKMLERIAELEAYNTKLRDWNAGLAQESCELQTKLATPVRLPNKHDDEFWFGSTFQVAKFDRAVERAISAAGFKVEGDE